MAYDILKKYLLATYPHLLNILTESQLEQIDWIESLNQTNERIGACISDLKLHIQQQRIFARLHFLFLLREGGETSYTRFINGQKDPKLTREHFNALSHSIIKLTVAEYQQLWVATLTSRSVEAVKRAEAAMNKKAPFDGVDFLAEVMSQAPEIYPAAAELLKQNPSARAGFEAMFNTGHFRHMMYIEGGPKMFSKLRDKIQNKMEKSAFDLWLSYWLIDITGFRAQTKELGSEYFNDNTYKAVSTLTKHLNHFFENPSSPILHKYLNDRANWLGFKETSATLFANNTDEIPRLILARIAAMQRLFTVDEKEGLQRGLYYLQNKLGNKCYQEMIDILNPLAERDEPTPTFGPALLANLRAETNYETAIILGLPLYARALTQYRQLYDEGKIEKSIPLNLNGLASVDNIKALVKGESFSVTINPSDGTTKLNPIEYQNTLEINKSLSSTLSPRHLFTTNQ